jgi:hypothetical protein
VLVYVSGLGMLDVCLRSVLTAGTLPEGEGVYHDDVGSTDNSITGSIGKLVP